MKIFVSELNLTFFISFKKKGIAVISNLKKENIWLRERLHAMEEAESEGKRNCKNEALRNEPT